MVKCPVCSERVSTYAERNGKRFCSEALVIWRVSSHTFPLKSPVLCSGSHIRVSDLPSVDGVEA